MRLNNFHNHDRQILYLYDQSESEHSSESDSDDSELLESTLQRDMKGLIQNLNLKKLGS